MRAYFSKANCPVVLARVTKNRDTGSVAEQGCVNLMHVEITSGKSRAAWITLARNTWFRIDLALGQYVVGCSFRTEAAARRCEKGVPL